MGRARLRAGTDRAGDGARVGSVLGLDLTPAMVERAGLEPDLTREVPFVIDFEEWVGRGSGGPAQADLIDRLLAEAPPAAASFVVGGNPGERTLTPRNSLHCWRVPS